MTGAPDPDDGGHVDVEAAWAQIILHWDDAPGGDARDGEARGGEPHVTTGPTGPPSPRPAPPSAPPTPRPGEPDASEQAPPGPTPSDPGSPGAPSGPTPSGRATGPGTGDVPGPAGPPLQPQGDRRARRVVRPGEPGAGRSPEVGWDAAASRVGGDRTGEAARYDAALDDAIEAEGFVPADPPPLPRGDLVSWLAWGGVLGAPLFLLLAALFWRTAPSVLVAAAVVAFVAGFGTLVVRMPDRADDEDDGAVV